MDAQKTAGVGCTALLSGLVVGLALDALVGGVLWYVLGAFGQHLNYWACVGIIFLLTFLLGMVAHANNK